MRPLFGALVLLLGVRAFACAVYGAEEQPKTLRPPPDSGSPPVGPDILVNSEGGDAPDAVADTSQPLSFCERERAKPGVVFCDDFETQNGAVPFGWDRSDLVGGELTIVSGAGKSGSRALRARSVGSVVTRQLTLWKAITDGGASSGHGIMTFSFAIPSSSIPFAQLGVMNFDGQQYGLAAWEKGQRLDQNHKPPDGTSLAAQLGSWHTATIEARRVEAVYQLKVVVDGANIDTYNGFGGDIPRIEVGVGLFATDGGGAGEVLIDDVVVQD